MVCKLKLAALTNWNQIINGIIIFESMRIEFSSSKIIWILNMTENEQRKKQRNTSFEHDLVCINWINVNAITNKDGTFENAEQIQFSFRVYGLLAPFNDEFCHWSLF